MQQFLKHSTWEVDRAEWIKKPTVQRIEHPHENEHVERGPRYLEFVRERERRNQKQ